MAENTDLHPQGSHFSHALTCIYPTVLKDEQCYVYIPSRKGVAGVSPPAVEVPAACPLFCLCTRTHTCTHTHSCLAKDPSVALAQL